MTAPMAPPPTGGPTNKGLWIGMGLVGVVGALVAGIAIGRCGADPGTPTSGASTPASQQVGTIEASGASGGVTVQGVPPPPAQPLKMEVPGDKATPALWVDVHAPARVRQALVENPWLREQMKKPLGQGFVGGWAAFLGSSGEDLKAGFQGAVFNVVAGKLLDEPFRAVWFTSEGRAGTPAFVVPRPGAAATAAYDAMDKAARRSEMLAEHCPGEEKGPEGGIRVQRWLVAEQALWAGRSADRLVFARHPLAVLQGLCAEPVKLEPAQGVDVEVGFASAQLGREAQLLSHVLGLSPGTRLQFAVEGTRLVGRGIAGTLAGGEPRLDSKPLSDDLLRLVPEETPVLLALQLKLPEQLDAETLKGYWEGKGAWRGPTLTRQVALAWTPRGDAALPNEVALLWGRTEDAVALQKMFSGPNALWRGDVCKHHVLASSDEVLGRMRKACEGKVPNMLNAAGPVVEGLRAPTSVAFGVHTGRLLSLLTADGWFSEQQVDPKKPLPRAAPKEVEAARRDLETLPYVGLRGTVKDGSLVPGGFGS